MLLTGVIKQVYFSNEKTAYAALRILSDEGIIVPVAGKIIRPQVGMRIEAEGEYDDHPKYGRQFKVTSCKTAVEKTYESVYQYLSSGFISGVSQILASRIIAKFGVNVVEEIIEKDPLRLCEIPGIGAATANKIAQSHAENFVYQELAAMGLSISQVHKLYEKYGKSAISVLKTTPYKPVYDIEGFGFRTVDIIAQKSGIAADDPRRVAAAITYSLLNLGDDGHCWCHIDNFAELIKKTIPDVSDELISDQLIEEFDSGRIIRDGDKVYAEQLYFAELSTAKGIAAMIESGKKMQLEGKVPVDEMQVNRAIFEMECENGFELEAQQKEAVRTAMQNRICIITGGPGTGKSTIAQAIVNAWMRQYSSYADPNDHIVLCAPTGRAARRASELTHVNGETIQRILAHNTYADSEDVKLFILDEASMMDIRLASRLLRLVAPKHHLVLIGDVDQLPPIGPGHFFRDCVMSPFIPTVHLTLCHRQKGKIAINAKRINDGLGFHALNFDDPSFRFVYADKMDAQECVIKEYMKFLQKGYSVRDVCCVVPVRKTGKSATAAEDLNPLIRDIVNPLPPSKAQASDLDKLRVGDRVMNTENNYDLQVFNGDCGIVSAIDDATGAITVSMDDHRLVEFNRFNATFLILAYATTVHKAQGSEYKAVIVVNNREHYYMLQRNLLYTAVTRAREELVLIGENSAIDLAVAKIPALERNTSLREKIKEQIITMR